MAFASPLVSSPPLEKPTETQLRTLSQALWSWACCDNCQNWDQCATQSCPSRRRKRLQRFFKYYTELTASYDPDIGVGEHPALQTHEDLLKIIRQLKLEPEITRAALATKLYGTPGERTPPVEDQERAINLAVKVMVMVNCSAERQSSGLLEHGAYQIAWRGDHTFCQFIQDTFPKTDSPTINADDSTPPLDMKTSLTARNLKKQIGLKIRPTDDIRRHLKLDRTEKIVDVYHHTAFLKEHLRLTKDKPPNMSVSDSLRLGALPRQLALECLDSIQNVLFPLLDPKSRSLLESLTATSSFDPDCLQWDFVSIRNKDEKDITYNYLGTRLASLYQELEDPTPTGWIETWFERKKGGRYAIMATLIGVLVAIFLGFAGLGLGGLQAWLTYQQWQHPVAPG